MRDEGRAGVSRPRRPRWRRLAAAVAAVAVVAIAFAPSLLVTPASVSRLVARGVPELDGEFACDAVRAGWLGPLEIEGVRVVPRGGGAAPLRIARIDVDRGLAAILASGGDVGTVRVAGLEADVVFDADHRSNLHGLFRPAAGDGGEPSGRRPRRSPLRLRLEVEDAIVRIAGPWSAEPWRSDPLDVRAALGPSADGAWSEWTLEPVDLLADARLEPDVAQGVLAYIAPIFAGAARTSGRFSLRLDGARLPVGSPGDGTLSGTLSMHEVVVGPGPLVANLLAALPASLPAPPDIRLADESHVAFRLAGRRVSHEGLEFGLPLAGPGRRLDVQSSGSVGIDDGSLDVRLRLPIPADMPADRPVLAALAGKSVSIGIGGVLGSPRVVFDGSIRDAAGDFVGDLVDRLQAGRAGDAPAADGDRTPAGDAAEVLVDAVGGLVEELARRRAERRAAEQANPEPAPRTEPAPRRRPRDRVRGDDDAAPGR